MCARAAPVDAAVALEHFRQRVFVSILDHRHRQRMAAALRRGVTATNTEKVAGSACFNRRQSITTVAILILTSIVIDGLMSYRSDADRAFGDTASPSASASSGSAHDSTASRKHERPSPSGDAISTRHSPALYSAACLQNLQCHIASFTCARRSELQLVLSDDDGHSARSHSSRTPETRPATRSPQAEAGLSRKSGLPRACCVTSSTAACRRRTISCSIFAGTKKPTQNSLPTPGKPASASVGTFGQIGEPPLRGDDKRLHAPAFHLRYNGRRADHRAMDLARDDRRRRGTTALEGMLTMEMPAFDMNSSMSRCEMPPTGFE